MAKLLMCLAMFIYSSMGFSATLDEHIAKHCKRGCVESYAVLNAAVTQADELKIDFKLIIAIIAVESGFILMAKNKGNVGLMQILLSAHKNKFMNNPFNVNENVKVGSSILKDCLIRQKSSLIPSLRCYNGGGDRKYPAKVLKTYAEIKSITW